MTGNASQDPQVALLIIGTVLLVGLTSCTNNSGGTGRVIEKGDASCPGDTPSCPAGGESCPCSDGNACNPPLTCSSHVCVNLTSDGSVDMPASPPPGAVISAGGATAIGGATTLGVGAAGGTGGSDAAATAGGTTTSGTRSTGGSTTLGVGGVGGAGGSDATGATGGTTAGGAGGTGGSTTLGVEGAGGSAGRDAAAGTGGTTSTETGGASEGSVDTPEPPSTGGGGSAGGTTNSGGSTTSSGGASDGAVGIDAGAATGGTTKVGTGGTGGSTNLPCPKLYSDNGIPTGTKIWIWSGAEWGMAPGVFDGTSTDCSGAPEGKTCFRSQSGVNPDAGGTNYAGWGVVALNTNNWDLSGCTRLIFCAQTEGTLTRLKVEIQTVNQSGTKYAAYPAVTPGAWQPIVITRDQFSGANLTSVFGGFLVTVEDGDQLFRIDDVRWDNGSGTLPAGTCQSQGTTGVVDAATSGPAVP